MAKSGHWSETNNEEARVQGFSSLSCSLGARLTRRRRAFSSAQTRVIASCDAESNLRRASHSLAVNSFGRLSKLSAKQSTSPYRAPIWRAIARYGNDVAISSAGRLKAQAVAGAKSGHCIQPVRRRALAILHDLRMPVLTARAFEGSLVVAWLNCLDLFQPHRGPAPRARWRRKHQASWIEFTGLRHV